MRFLQIWYQALKQPVEMSADNKAVAIRIRFRLNHVRALDRELYSMKYGGLEHWPLEMMTTEIEQRSPGYVVIVKEDLAIVGALTSAGVLEAHPLIDADAAWIACEERVMAFKNAEFVQRARAGQLTPDDIFPMPVRGDGRE
jgi:hypothetical protein